VTSPNDPDPDGDGYMTRPPSRVDGILSQLVGHHIDGGCMDCGAYQSVRRDGHGVWHVTVHHDDTCPYWRLIR
jgi:hypothetical protein